MSLNIHKINNRSIYQILDFKREEELRILESPIPFGRHTIAVADLTVNETIFLIELFFTQTEVILLAISSNHSITQPNQWDFSYENLKMILRYNNGDLYIKSTENISNVYITEFQMCNSYTNSNLYGIDFLQSGNPAIGSNITFQSPIFQSYTGSNSINFGQQTVTQLVDIKTPVTINSSSGIITTVSSDISPGNMESFTVNNTVVSLTSVVILTVQNNGTQGLPYVTISNKITGSFQINLHNIGTQVLNGSVSVSFVCL